MLKQKGFTLIELMVVMAIIAILATAGLSAFGGYLKKARDTKRISDLKGIETVVVSTLGMTGSAPTVVQLRTGFSDLNNGRILEDPMNGQSVCLAGDLSGKVACNYQYFPCDTFMGYIIKIQFEDYGNANGKYNEIFGGGLTGYFVVGKCGAEQTGVGIGGVI